ncbi:MAG: hypothetical protein H8D24_07975 [Gammaproteobacteria bacterium]|uniref:Uncharacterized protein n=1 Tax=Candidatus Thiopontia autotrophica TaxID=2841688 RepID=A0A8J6TQQ1_9GAMM|nr:hypothetical protein [Candidatus Thiopontia autotrophica]MBL6969187.1 hypothetical protein [Gammaproteobacteria bacterium]
MLWNFMMHALMGWLGAYFFLPTAERIGIAILVVCVTQAADQVRIRKEKFAEIEALPEKDREQAGRELEQNITRLMSKIFVQNVALYTAVLLLTAHAARLNGWL